MVAKSDPPVTLAVTIVGPMVVLFRDLFRKSVSGGIFDGFGWILIGFWMNLG